MKQATIRRLHGLQFEGQAHLFSASTNFYMARSTQDERAAAAAPTTTATAAIASKMNDPPRRERKSRGNSKRRPLKKCGSVKKVREIGRGKERTDGWTDARQTNAVFQFKPRFERPDKAPVEDQADSWSLERPFYARPNEYERSARLAPRESENVDASN